MSSYDNDDVLVPPGVRVLTRPGVTYIPAAPSAAVEPPPVPPRPTPPPAPLPPRSPSPPVEIHPVQPLPAQASSPRTAKPQRPVVVIVPRGRVFVHDDSLVVSAADPNAALLQGNTTAELEPSLTERSLAKHRPAPQDRQVHPIQPRDLSPTTPTLPPAASVITGTLSDFAKGVWHVFIRNSEQHHEEADAIQRALETGERYSRFIDPDLPTEAEKAAGKPVTPKPQPPEASFPGEGYGIPSRGQFGGAGGGRIELDY